MVTVEWTLWLLAGLIISDSWHISVFLCQSVLIFVFVAGSIVSEVPESVGAADGAAAVSHCYLHGYAANKPCMVVAASTSNSTSTFLISYLKKVAQTCGWLVLLSRPHTQAQVLTELLSADQVEAGGFED